MTRTLADMTPAEQQQCIGMWCANLASTAKTPSPVVLACVQGERCWILHTTIHGNWSCFPLDAVAPRLDLPRAWTPTGEPVPVNAEYQAAYYQTMNDGTRTLNLMGVEHPTREEAEWERDDIQREDPETDFFIARRLIADWEEA